MSPKTNLTPYDWACLRVEFMRNRLHVDDWIATLTQLGAMVVGFWIVKDHTEGNDLLGLLGGFAVLIGASIFKHYVMKKARAEFAQAEEDRDRLYFQAEDGHTQRLVEDTDAS